MSFKKGDIVTVFGNPVECTYPIGQARLVELIKDSETEQAWNVEYTNDEGHIYLAVIKKQLTPSVK